MPASNDRTHMGQRPPTAPGSSRSSPLPVLISLRVTDLLDAVNVPASGRVPGFLGSVPGMRVVIAGAHGKIGLLLGRRLAGRGDAVLGIVRNPDHEDDLRAAGVEPLVLDLEST